MLYHKDCDFVLLLKTPEGKIYNVIIDQDKIKEFLSYSSNGSILVDKEEIKGVDFEIKK